MDRLSRASELMIEAGTALARGDMDRALALHEAACEAEPRLRRSATKGPKTVEELMPLLRRKEAAGPVLRQLRRSLGLSQQRAAEICGIAGSTIAHCESGRQAMSQEAMTRLLEYMAKSGASTIEEGSPPPQALLRLRQNLGLTQAALASTLGVKETVVRRIETGNMAAPIHVLDGYRRLAAEQGIELAPRVETYRGAPAGGNAG